MQYCFPRLFEIVLNSYLRGDIIMENKNKSVSSNVPVSTASTEGLPPTVTAENTEYIKAFHIYDKALIELKELLEDDLSEEKQLLKFNIRIRINLSLKPTFSEQYGYLKSEKQIKIYNLFYKLVDTWFVYEVIKSLDTSVDNYYDTLKLLSGSDARDIVKSFNKQFEERIIKITKREEDMLSYLDHLCEICSQQSLINRLEKLKTNVEQKIGINHDQIIALVYAVRVAYVHKSDTAKAGVNNYETKIQLLSLLYEYLIEFMLKAATNVIKKKIAEVS